MKLMLAGVAVLVLVNLWRWWPQDAEKPATQTRAQVTQSQALELRLVGYNPDAGKEITIRRDLFFPVDEATDKVAREETTSRKPVRTQENSQRERILRELEKYKLVGILSRHGTRQGFLMRDEENFSVKQGDRLENRYSVEEITLTSVTLSDPASRVSRKIELK
ncbi:MAG: hypothetical protein PVG13_07730 [Thiohalophilus sp.]|jgi:Tfp pilus assembly protein PilP